MFNPAQLDTTIIVALITGAISLLISIITVMVNKRNRDSESYKSMQETIEGLHRDITAQDKRIGFLSNLVVSEEEKRRNAETELLQSRQKDLEFTAYLRAIGHWIGQLCDVLDPKWSKTHPKPRLPDSIRSEVEQATTQLGLDATVAPTGLSESKHKKRKKHRKEIL
ncbi:hypothetical protein ACFQ1H_02510 [Scardovia wiggsiae]|uniref:hypothetical protein n=1 Tax=Scardovia wiggsiae TaxID=230143 RepID=UPI00363C34EC